MTWEQDGAYASQQQMMVIHSRITEVVVTNHAGDVKDCVGAIASVVSLK